MIILIDTSTFRATIGLGDEKLVDSHSWDSKQNLSDTLLVELDRILRKNNIEPKDLKGVITYLGPGSYTGLRIGITTANTFAYSLNTPIVGVQGEAPGEEKMIIDEMKAQDLEELLESGNDKLKSAKVGEYLVPFYGKEPNIG